MLGSVEWAMARGTGCVGPKLTVLLLMWVSHLRCLLVQLASLHQLGGEQRVHAQQMELQQASCMAELAGMGLQTASKLKHAHVHD